MELYFQAKADAYRAVMKQVGEFALHPNEVEYQALLSACEVASIFASGKVAEALKKLIAEAQHLRSAPSESERENVAVTTWYEAAEKLREAMRDDLEP